MELLLNEYRGNIIENQYYGNICIIKDENIIFSIGDSFQKAFARSTEKIIHTIPIVYYNIHQKYGLTDDEIAIMMSSHVSDRENLKSIESLVSKTNIDIDTLICEETLPISIFTLTTNILKKKSMQSKINNMCIGNHIASILLCRELNLSEKDYWKISHNVNNIILNYMYDFSKTLDIEMSYDNCGMPCYCMPLYNLAVLFMNINSSNSANERMRGAVDVVNNVLHRYNGFIDGKNSLTEALLSDSNIIAKSGSYGIFCFSLKKERISLAIKLNGQLHEQIAFIVLEILKKLNYKNAELLLRLERLASRSEHVSNGCRVVSRKLSFDNQLNNLT